MSEKIIHVLHRFYKLNECCMHAGCYTTRLRNLLKMLGAKRRLEIKWKCRVENAIFVSWLQKIIEKEQKQQHIKEAGNILLKGCTAGV